MSEQLYNLRTAYQVLQDRVIRALRTQLGDVERLGEQRNQTLQFLQAAELVSQNNMLIGQTYTECITVMLSCRRVCDAATKYC